MAPRMSPMAADCCRIGDPEGDDVPSLTNSGRFTRRSYELLLQCVEHASESEAFADDDAELASLYDLLIAKLTRSTDR